jgi:hypothetical protein
MSDTLKRLKSMRKEPEALWRYLEIAVEHLEKIADPAAKIRWTDDCDGTPIAEDVWRDRSQRIAVAKKALNRLRPWERKDGYFGDRPLAHVKRRAYASDNMVDPREPGEGSGDGRS